MKEKIRVGVVGATGMVGQRFLSLLEHHPWFDVVLVAASSHSAGKTYEEAVKNRWAMSTPIPERVKSYTVYDANKVEAIAQEVDFVFCAVDMPKEDIIILEEAYARREIPVVSNNSANRMTPDVPMIMPEVNWHHAEIIPVQKKRLGTKHGFIAVKPNCSLQSYVPALHPLMDLDIKEVMVCTYQAISGAGKTFESWPEMVDNVIPFIKGEEEKSEKEPLKIWGKLAHDHIEHATSPQISAQCIRVAVSDGHMAAVSVRFGKKTSKEEILHRWKTWLPRPQELQLPSAPQPFLTYFEEENRPQTKLDRDIGHGMGVALGRLREDSIMDYKFISLSHNTIRGAAGGAILTAELLCADGYIYHR